MAIKSYFRFAELSVEEKKAERFEKVIEECNEFIDRFPESQIGKEVTGLFNFISKQFKNYIQMSQLRRQLSASTCQ